MKPLLWLACVVAHMCYVEAGKVLFMPHPYILSHSRLIYGLATQMQRRGHQVTILRWPATAATAGMAAPANVSVIDYRTERREWVLEMIDVIVWTIPDTYTYLDYIRFMFKGPTAIYETVQSVANNPRLLTQLRREKFDLIVLDPHAHSPSWMIANQIGAPYISITPSITDTYYLDRAALTPTPFSYVPSIINGFSDRMTLTEKVLNIFDHCVIASLFWWWMEWVIPLVTTWSDVSHRPLLLLTLSNNFVEYARLLPGPSTLTLRTAGVKPLVETPDTDQLPPLVLDADSAGTLIFSLTTLGLSQSTPEQIKQPMAQALTQLTDYRIIWRKMSAAENSSLERAAHVHTTHWYNQMHVLGHEKTRLLITHGGLATIMEAVTHGIPMLMLPLGFDHHANTARVVNKGLALRLSKNNLSAQQLYDQATTLLTDKSYSRRALKYRAMIADSKRLLADPFGFYLEYAVKHGERLRVLGAKGESGWAWQYFLLDIAFVYGVVAAVFVRFITADHSTTISVA